MKRLLVFHPAIAPYRIDFFNELNSRFSAKFCFYFNTIKSQNFSTESVSSKLKFKPSYLKYGVNLGYRDRVFRFGILQNIIKHRPNYILCSEYSVSTLLALFYVRMFYKSIKIYTICDDSLDIATDCKGLRKVARRIVVNFIDGIILCNEPVLNWYSLKFPKLKTISFPIIQDEKRLRNNLIEIDKLFHKYQLKYGLENKRVYLYIGRFVPVKNLEFLIKTFSEYIQSGQKKDILILIGDGPLKNDLTDLVKALNLSKHVLLPGRFDDKELYAWYRLSDYFILPSAYEPFGAVVNEALIFGLPVLCSELAGSTYLISEDNGKTFNPFNKQQLLSIFNNFTLTPKNGENLMPFAFGEKLNQVIDFIYTETVEI